MSRIRRSTAAVIGGLMLVTGCTPGATLSGSDALFLGALGALTVNAVRLDARASTPSMIGTETYDEWTARIESGGSSIRRATIPVHVTAGNCGSLYKNYGKVYYDPVEDYRIDDPWHTAAGASFNGRYGHTSGEFATVDVRVDILGSASDGDCIHNPQLTIGNLLPKACLSVIAEWSNGRWATDSWRTQFTVRPLSYVTESLVPIATWNALGRDFDPSQSSLKVGYAGPPLPDSRVHLTLIGLPLSECSSV